MADLDDGPAFGDQLLCDLERADDLLSSVTGAFHGRASSLVWPDEYSHSPWTNIFGSTHSLTGDNHKAIILKKFHMFFLTHNCCEFQLSSFIPFYYPKIIGSRITGFFDVYGHIISNGKWKNSHLGTFEAGAYTELHGGNSPAGTRFISVVRAGTRVEDECDDLGYHAKNLVRGCVPSFRANLSVQLGQSLTTSYTGEIPLFPTRATCISIIPTILSGELNSKDLQLHLILVSLIREPAEIPISIFILDPDTKESSSIGFAQTNQASMINLSDYDTGGKVIYAPGGFVPIYLLKSKSGITIEHSHPIQEYMDPVWRMSGQRYFKNMLIESCDAQSIAYINIAN